MDVISLGLESFPVSVIHHWYFRWLDLQENLKGKVVHSKLRSVEDRSPSRKGIK